MKLRIFHEEDRLTVAAILIKNGYRVEQGKEPRPGTKTADYYLLLEDTRGEKQ